MAKLLDFSVDDAFFPKESSLFLSPGAQVGVYFPSRKRSRVTAPFVVSGKKPLQPTIEILPDECLFEIFRRLPGGQERSAAACVSKRWLMLLSTICKDEMCTPPVTQHVEPKIQVDSQEDKSAKTKEKDEVGDLNVVGSEDEKFQETDSCGYLSRSLEGKKATDIRLVAISVGTSSRGGLGKLSIRGNASTKLTNVGLRAIARGCPSLRVLSMWNVSTVNDEGLSEIATGCHSIEKLDLCHCPAITDKGVTAIAVNCPNLMSVTIESCTHIGNESLQALGRNCPKLKHIKIRNCPLVGDQGVAGLFSSAGHIITKANFQSLNVSDVSLAVIGHYGSAMTDLTLGGLHNVNERGFWVMGKGQGLQKLKSLTITSCRGVSDLGLEAIGQGCPDLKLFRLQKCALVSDNGVLSFSKAAGSLESFHLEECHNITICGLFGILENCGGKLKAMTLAKCLGIRDGAFQYPLTSSFCSLRSLTIRNCPGVGDACLGILSGICPNVTHINLSGLQGITDSGVMPLVQRSEAGLTKVDLSGCVNLTDKVVAEITMLHGETLDVLNLDGCRHITDMSLVAVARNCSIISELNISKSRITASGIAALAGAGQLSLQILSLADCAWLSDKSLPFLGVLGKSLVGLNIQKCSGISYNAINLLVEKLWRCDILC